MERLWGTGTPNGAGPPAGWTGSPVQPAVVAYGARVVHSNPQRRGPTGWGDRQSCTAGGRSPCSGVGDTSPVRCGPTGQGDGESYPAMVSAYGALVGDGSPQRRTPTYWVDGDSHPGGGRSR